MPTPVRIQIIHGTDQRVYAWHQPGLGTEHLVLRAAQMLLIERDQVQLRVPWRLTERLAAMLSFSLQPGMEAAWDLTADRYQGRLRARSDGRYGWLSGHGVCVADADHDQLRVPVSAIAQLQADAERLGRGTSWEGLPTTATSALPAPTRRPALATQLHARRSLARR